MISSKEFLVFISIFLLLSTFSCGEDVRPLQDNWERAVPFQEVPQGLVSIRAKDCGVCHREIYEEWKLSTHAHAWTDLQFQAELQKESSPYLCINCHIPLENQQENFVKGLVEGDIYRPVLEPNPRFDPEFQLEGISCASCHVREGSIIGLHGTDIAPHPVRRDSTFLSEQICISCHNASAVVTPELVCTFQTGDEWMNGPFYGSKNCISCHMDTVTRPLMQGLQPRKGHRHWFAGSGIPKRFDVEAKGLQGMAYYPDTLAPVVNNMDSVAFTITLRNELAGHRLPTGDPERFYFIDMAWLGSQGDTLAHQVDRIGEKWEWYPVARKVDDNNMNPGEARSYSILLPDGVKGDVSIRARVTKHRMDVETAKYNGLTEEYPIFITEFEYEQRILVR